MKLVIPLLIKSYILKQDAGLFPSLTFNHCFIIFKKGSASTSENGLKGGVTLEF